MRKGQTWPPTFSYFDRFFIQPWLPSPITNLWFAKINKNSEKDQFIHSLVQFSDKKYSLGRLFDQRLSKSNNFIPLLRRISVINNLSLWNCWASLTFKSNGLWWLTWTFKNQHLTSLGQFMNHGPWKYRWPNQVLPRFTYVQSSQG